MLEGSLNDTKNISQKKVLWEKKCEGLADCIVLL